jgi:GT2 family glycosyltransferase
MPHDLSVVILNWNTCADLRKCLASILGQTWISAVQVVVADNASEDESRSMVAAEFPGAVLCVHTSNLGFATGNNRALPHADGRYVLFLNPDTIVTDGALDTLVAYADAHPEAGIVGPKLLNADGSLQFSCRAFPDLGAGFFRNTPLGRLFPKNRFTSDYLMSDWDHDAPRTVDWVSGAALMIRRDALERTQGFDEGFFMYCEDVDLCYRVHSLGHLVQYVPDAVIYHLIGRSSDRVPTRMTYEFHRSMYRFYRKHYAAQTPIWIRPLIVPGLVARASGRLIRYKAKNLLRGPRK